MTHAQCLQNEAALLVFRGDFGLETTRGARSLAACRFILRLLRHHGGKFKQADRMMLSQYDFTLNLQASSAWELLHNGTRLLLADLGAQLRDDYAREQLQERLGPYQPPMVAGHTCRQDFALPHPPGCTWEQQEQEEVYIHFLRLIAYAIDERYQRAVADCVEPFNCDKKPFSHRGIKSIKGFPRMFNKMLSAEDHRYEPKPRPGLILALGSTRWASIECWHTVVIRTDR